MEQISDFSIFSLFKWLDLDTILPSEAIKIVSYFFKKKSDEM